MSGQGDLMLRSWAMLRAIPTEPQRRTTAEIQQALSEQDFEVDLRTVQRDLNTLSQSFGYTSVREGRSSYWYWPKATKGLTLPAMDPTTAMVFSLVREHVSPLLPVSVMKCMQPYFERSKAVLADERQTSLAGWQRKVRVLQRGPSLMPPDIRPEVHEAVGDALLRGRQLTILYQPRHLPKAREYPVHPLGLVIRDGVFYLVATTGDREGYNHYALHRMKGATVQDDAARIPRGFQLSEYIEQDGAFSLPTSQGRIRLEMRITVELAKHLIERPLSKEQVITDAVDGWATLTATVMDTAELRWWLLALGPGVRVVAPVGLRDAIVESLDTARENYRVAKDASPVKRHS